MAWAIEALTPYGEVPARHHAFLLRELETVALGETDRLMVFMPPGSAKTRYASIVFPAWMLAQRIGVDMIGASYNGDYANDLSGQIIRLIQENTETLGYRLISDSRQLWRTNNRGQYRAAGAGGGITGRRADLFVIDDPIKGREDADSEIIREKVWKWYRAEVVTRLKPKARIILIQTRWHHDDLAGRLLNSPRAGDWRVVELPAFAEADDALGRKPGEPLWPEWEDREALERKREEVGPREWASLFQQRPTPTEGALFKVLMLQTLDAAPICSAMVRSWDLAGTEAKRGSNPDYTVGLKMGRTPVGQYVIPDIVRLRGGPDEVLAAIVNTAKADGKMVTVRLPEDPGQAGKQQVLHLTRALAGYRVVSDRESGNKEVRAGPVASQVNIGNVAVVRAPWNATFREELADFAAGTYDDQVDALSGAFGVIGLGDMPMRISETATRRAAGAHAVR
jgi:predicted phage terminase large subunit-like protein